MRSWFVVLLSCAVLAAAPGLARAADLPPDPGLLDEFDARGLTQAEKRLLQVGLTAAGAYRGLIDGAWGAASQAALERFVAENGLAEPDGKVRDYHMAILAKAARDAVADEGLAYRDGGAHRLILPPGGFAPDPEAGGREFEAAGLVVWSFTSGAGDAAEAHRAAEAPMDAGSEPYVLRREDRWVTAIGDSPQRLYVRTDRSAGGADFHTTAVIEGDGADPGLFDVAVASITLDLASRLDTPAGRLARAIGEVEAILSASAAPAPAAASVAAPAPMRLTEPIGSGTAFYVTARDLVTAAHVIEGCGRVELTSGEPLEILAVHPELDLALLGSPVRSRDWILVDGGRAARLGQNVIALGYPFFGTLGTALTMTGGHVSALSGLQDAADALTISAAVQPGNSGGPLIGRDGAAIGVVVARLDGLAVAEATGALPENVGYAVSAPALVDFLVAEAVALPQPFPAAAIDDGVPEAMQRAVVPILCYAG